LTIILYTVLAAVLQHLHTATDNTVVFNTVFKYFYQRICHNTR